MIRGWKVESITIPAMVTADGAVAAGLTPYADICADCGMVCLFVRVGEIQIGPA